MNRTPITAICLLAATFTVACAQGTTGFAPDDDGAAVTPGVEATPAFSIIDSCTAACLGAGSDACPDFGADTCFDQCVDLQSNTECHDTAHDLVACWTTDFELCGGPAVGDCTEAKAVHRTCVTGVEPDTASTTASTSSGGGGGACAHSECTEGAPLSMSCSPCAAEVCSQDPYCCDTEWDSVCTDLALSVLSCGC